MKYLIFIFIFCFCNSCILLPYRPPRSNKYVLQNENRIGLKNGSPLRTSGIYCFNYLDTVTNLGQWYSGYYRFTQNGELRMTNGIKGFFTPSEIFRITHKSIQMDIDKHFYGYYSASSSNVDLEYIWELRENLTEIFYESSGYLSANGDTLFISQQKNRKHKKVEVLNLTCLYYEFPKN